MKVLLHRYWIEFKSPESGTEANFPWPLIRFYVEQQRFGCGVTAYTLEDAIYLVQRDVFRGEPFPEIDKAIEDVDIGGLDVFNDPHYRNNFGAPFWRGIWFPIGFQNSVERR